MSSTHVEALENLLRSRDRLDNAEIGAVLVRLSSEIRHRLTGGSSGSVDFIEASVRALCRIKNPTHANLVMECLCDSAQFLYSNGRSAEALKAAGRCHELAERANSHEWIGRSNQLNGILHADIGNVGEALICYSRALTSAQRTKEMVREVATLSCLGVAYNYGGLYSHALPCFNRALLLAESPEYRQKASAVGPMADEYPRGALTNKAQSHLWLEQFDEGFAAIDRVIRTNPEPWDALSSERRVIREATFVRLALELGKIALARQHVQDARRFGLTATERARFYCEGTAALCEVHGGNAKLGIEKLERLLVKAHGAPERTVVLWDLVRAYDQTGQPEAALDRVRHLVTCLKALREASLRATLAVGFGSIVSDGQPDSFQVREALLRAKVSERQLATQQMEMFERLAMTADLKEDESGQHGYRVGKLAALLCERLHWSQSKISIIETAARLHDIGKIAMPDRVLFNSALLSTVEREVMSTHTIVGGELLSKGNTSGLRMAEEIARHHHEWWDGSGYPSRMSSKRIPIHARIVALADAFDALTHGRPYAARCSIDHAIKEIGARRGSQFDPDLTDVFVELVTDLQKQHVDLDAYLSESSRESPFHQARNNIRAMLEGGAHAQNLSAAATEAVH
jgi:putative two-component system response regulator